MSRKLALSGARGQLQNPAETAQILSFWPISGFGDIMVAIPFSPDDLIYGRISRSSPESGMNLGSLEPRGERGVLRVSLNHFMRLRYNPFFPYTKKRMIEAIRRHTARGDS